MPHVKIQPLSQTNTSMCSSFLAKDQQKGSGADCSKKKRDQYVFAQDVHQCSWHAANQAPRINHDYLFSSTVNRCYCFLNIRHGLSYIRLVVVESLNQTGSASPNIR